MRRFEERQSRTQRDRESVAKPAPARERSAPARELVPLSADAVLRLQSSAGNAAVQRAIRRKEATEETASGWSEWLFGPTEGEKNDTGESPGTAWRWLSWAGIGSADIVAEMVEVLGFEGYDVSADFLNHYMSGRGADYELELPETWKQTIASKYKKKGTYRDVSGYNWGIPDMKNSLGHFNLTVEDIEGGGKRYTVTDRYHFPATAKGKAVQHGFEVDFFGKLPAQAQKSVNDALARLGTWKHPSGLTEKFEVVRMGGKWTFIVPQQWLVDSGVDFNVHSSFVVPPDQAATRAAN